jgi:acetyl esterase/lipase
VDRSRSTLDNQRMSRIFIVSTLAVALAANAAAQEMRFFYPAPAADTIDVSKDVAYGELKMDVYRPRQATGQLPALIFFNIAAGAQRSNPFYKAWAEIAASKSVVAILPDLAGETFAKDFAALVAHLRINAAKLGIDGERVAVYAGSGNVFRALPIVQDPKQTFVKAAIMYYAVPPRSATAIRARRPGSSAGEP